MDRRDEREDGQSRIVGLHDDDGSFDRRFWEEQGPTRRLEAVWELTLQYLEFHPEAGESRLREVFAALNAERVEYLLVGGYALAFHAVPRFTKDLDVWIRSSPENAARAYRGLKAFGAPMQPLTEKDLTTSDIVYQIGIAPNRIDILTSIDGVSFDEAWPNRVRGTYGDQEITVISREDLIRNKSASARPQDLVDVDTLKKTKGGTP